MSRSLMEVTPDEIGVWCDKLEDEGLTTDLSGLLIADLAFPRWLKESCKTKLKERLPNFNAWVEGKPKGRHTRHNVRLQHFQCEHRLVQLFEKKVLERLLTLLDVTDLERHCYSPLWYVHYYDGEKGSIQEGCKVRCLVQYQGKSGQLHTLLDQLARDQ